MIYWQKWEGEMVKKGQERRKYLRVEAPLSIRVINKDNSVYQTTAKDISPLGLRFEAGKYNIEMNDELELKIEIPKILSPVHAKAKVVWKRKISTENSSPYDIGCEFVKIEEDNKNTFLKYFCDLLYNQPETSKKKGEE